MIDNTAFEAISATGDHPRDHDVGCSPATCKWYGRADPVERSDLPGTIFEFVLGHVLIDRDRSTIAGCRKRLQRKVGLLMSACWTAIAYSRVGTGRTPSEVLSSSNFPTSHLGLELPLTAQSHRPFSIFAHPHSSNASFAGGWALFSAGRRWRCQQFRLQIGFELFDCSTDQDGSLSISGR